MPPTVATVATALRATWVFQRQPAPTEVAVVVAAKEVPHLGLEALAAAAKAAAAGNILTVVFRTRAVLVAAAAGRVAMAVMAVRALSSSDTRWPHNG